MLAFRRLFMATVTLVAVICSGCGDELADKRAESTKASATVTRIP